MHKKPAQPVLDLLQHSLSNAQHATDANSPVSLTLQSAVRDQQRFCSSNNVGSKSTSKVPVLMKMDVEGHGGLVVKGGLQTLLQSDIPYITFEFVPD